MLGKKNRRQDLVSGGVLSVPKTLGEARKEAKIHLEAETIYKSNSLP